LEFVSEEGLEGEWKKGTCPLCMGNDGFQAFIAYLPRNQKMEEAVYE
jgi:hypothetical protein